MSAPLYAGLAAELRQKITSGAHQPGGRLPSESELQAEHGVSRHTVRQALMLLAREGLIISGQGRGWYVREVRPLNWTASRTERNLSTDQVPNDAWARDVRGQGRRPTERIEVAMIRAEARVAERLDLATGATVVVRRRYRYIDGEIYATADTYYPEPIVRGTPIAEPDDVLPGVYAVMAKMGYGWERYADEIVSRPASRDEADRLGVYPGDPLTEHWRTRLTARGEAVALMHTVAPGDRLVIRYEGRWDTDGGE